MAEKREPLYYIIGAALIGFAIFIDIYFAGNAGAADPSWLGSRFTGNILDWSGLVLFNAGLIGMALGMFGVWEIVTSKGSALNRLWIVALAVSLLLIYM